MRLRSDLSFLPLDDEVVVFSEETQSLIGLNASAAYIAQQVCTGTPSSSIARELVKNGMASATDAESWIDATLEALRSHGLAADGAARQFSVSAELQSQQEQQARRIAMMPTFAPLAA